MKRSVAGREGHLTEEGAKRIAPKDNRVSLKQIPFLLLSVPSAFALFVVDARADASFDAPKRLVAMLAIAAATVALAFVREREAAPWTRGQRAIAACAALALTLILTSAWLSPHRAVALDTVRTMVVFALVPILCAADERGWRWMANAFLVGVCVNAVVSIAQWLNIAQPFQYGGGGRGSASAMIGNSGVLGLLAAIGVLLMIPRLARSAIGMWAVLALLLATIVINRSTTPLIVIGAGALAVAPRVLRRGTIAAAALLFTVAATTDAPYRLDKVLTYRIGPWKAALSMAAESPLLGFGPGTYGAEYARHADARFVNPYLLGSFAQAHNDYLQAFAELGVPATLLLVAVLFLLMRGARGRPAVLAVLVAGAVAALTWFPLQRPETAMILLAACGQAWRDA